MERHGGDIGALAAAVAAVAHDSRPAAKGGKNTHDRYEYARDVDLLHAVVPAMARHGLALILHDVAIDYADTGQTTRNGAQIIEARVLATYILAHSGGGWMRVVAPGAGRDHGDKGAYKAMTGAYKYALRQTFAIATGDDPEASDDRGRDTSRPAPPPRPARPVADILGDLELSPTELDAWLTSKGRPVVADLPDAERGKLAAWLDGPGGRVVRDGVRAMRGDE